MSAPDKKLLHIALAVVRDTAGRVLLAHRPEDKHQGGLWEFPGGKVEAGETVVEALARELQEEVGIVPTSPQPLIQISHHYPEVSVLLDCWEVDQFSGSASGCEGQPICWETPEQLVRYPFPEANRALIKAVQLPKRYWITPDRAVSAIQAELSQRLAAGVRLVRLRAPGLSLSERLLLAESMAEQLSAVSGQLVVGLEEWQGGASQYASAVQLNRHQLMGLPGGGTVEQQIQSLREQGCTWLGGSCHSEEELTRAQQLGCDFATLSPYQSTESHPGAPVLGADKAQALLKSAQLPVYLLGGVSDQQLSEVRMLGAQGVAGIRSVGRAQDRNGLAQ